MAGALGTAYSGSVVIDRTQLSVISLPALLTVPANLRIQDNDALTSLDVPQLTSLGPSLTIVDNTTLPNCYAIDLLAQLQGAGWAGAWTISGNDGSGTCP